MNLKSVRFIYFWHSWSVQYLFKEKNIIITYGKTQSCKVSSGLLRSVLSALAQTVALIVMSGLECCKIVHEPGRQGTPEARQRLIIIGKGPRRMKENRLHSTMSSSTYVPGRDCMSRYYLVISPLHSVGTPSPRLSSFTHVVFLYVSSTSRLRHRFSIVEMHYRSLYPISL